jgi:GDP-4-dehydro-6-deoxy-D-mannose reductase
MKALITGGNGFVGRHLAEHLMALGDQVTSVDVECDVADTQAMQSVVAAAQPDVIYHLAALSHVGTSWSNPSEVLRVNVIGTASVLAASRATAPDAMTVVISSAEVYGVVQPSQMPLNEGAAIRPVTPYAASKAAAELVTLQAVLGYNQRAITVRPFNHFGPGQSTNFFIPAMANRLLRAEEQGLTSIAVGTLTTRRDFTDVRDVVRAYRLLGEHGTSGETYVVASGVDRSMQEIADELRRVVHSSVTFAEDPELLRPADIPLLRGDSQKLYDATGWCPTIDFTTSLEDTVAALR